IDINHHHLHPDSTTVRIKGFLYANTLPQLEKTLQTVAASIKKKLILDLSETNYVSSGGWGLIMTFFKRTQDAGGSLVLAGMKPEVYDAFELLEYDKVLRSFPSVDSAFKEGFSPSAGKREDLNGAASQAK
ncbi:MAG TPA: STAS domain-containing protein, partial [bacterium]|nr:STAS domain-containing protein [bacterium]